MPHSLQDHQLCHSRDYAHRNPKYWMEILDCVDRSQCSLPSNYLLPLSRDRLDQLCNMLYRLHANYV
jgi:hypothetical protein